MAELVDAPALGAGAFGRAGSNPAPRTTHWILSFLYLMRYAGGTVCDLIGDTPVDVARLGAY
jgi:hypothetical protein